MVLNGEQVYFRLDEQKLCSSDLKGKGPNYIISKFRRGKQINRSKIGRIFFRSVEHF